MKKIIAIEDKIVVEVLKKEERTPGGIFVPNTADSDPQIYGLVVSVGDKVLSIKEGETVVCAKHGGQAFLLDGKIFKCYMLSEIYSIIEEN